MPGFDIAELLAGRSKAIARVGQDHVNLGTRRHDVRAIVRARRDRRRGIVIAEQVITTTSSVAIAAVALALLLQRRVKVPELALVAAAAAVGIIALR